MKPYMSPLNAMKKGESREEIILYVAQVNIIMQRHRIHSYLSAIFALPLLVPETTHFPTIVV